MTGPLEVDHLSWAQRVGADVRVRLLLPGAPMEAGPAEVELSDGDGATLRARAEATVVEGALTLLFDVAQSALGAAPWHLALRSPDGVATPVAARLLAAPGLPVALLPGPAPRTRLRPPAPRAAGSAARPVTRPAARSLVSRVARRLPAPARAALVAARERGRALARTRG